MPGRESLGSVRNAVRVLKAFTSTHREWGVSDLARHLDIGKSTVHRLLVTLTDEGADIAQHLEGMVMKFFKIESGTKKQPSGKSRKGKK